METNIIEPAAAPSPTRKLEIIQEAYLQIRIFFWNHINDHFPEGKVALTYFNKFHDAGHDLEERFENGDFKSEEDREFIDDQLEQLYYMVVEIEPGAFILGYLHLTIEMIENGWNDIRSPR